MPGSGASLKDHLHLGANSAAVKFQRLFATTVEKQIWLHRHICVSHTRSLRFVWLTVDVLLLTAFYLASEPGRMRLEAMMLSPAVESTYVTVTAAA